MESLLILLGGLLRKQETLKLLRPFLGLHLYCGYLYSILGLYMHDRIVKVETFDAQAGTRLVKYNLGITSVIISALHIICLRISK